MSSLRRCCIIVKPKALWLATEPSGKKKTNTIENLNILSFVGSSFPPFEVKQVIEEIIYRKKHGRYGR